MQCFCLFFLNLASEKSWNLVSNGFRVSESKVTIARTYSPVAFVMGFPIESSTAFTYMWHSNTSQTLSDKNLSLSSYANVNTRLPFKVFPVCERHKTKTDRFWQSEFVSRSLTRSLTRSAPPIYRKSQTQVFGAFQDKCLIFNCWWQQRAKKKWLNNRNKPQGRYENRTGETKSLAVFLFGLLRIITKLVNALRVRMKRKAAAPTEELRLAGPNCDHRCLCRKLQHHHQSLPASETGALQMHPACGGKAKCFFLFVTSE